MGCCGVNPPARKVFADAAHLQLDAKFLAYELAYCSTAPEMEFHLELLWARVDDQALNGVLLLLTQHSAITFGAPTQSRSDCAPATRLIQVNGGAHRRVAQCPVIGTICMIFMPLLCSLTTCFRRSWSRSNVWFLASSFSIKG
jgi:hypothetical protein